MIRSMVDKDLLLYIIQALIWATAWFVMLGIEGYPMNEWVGVVVVGYLAWHVSYTLITKATIFALVRVYKYAVDTYGEPGEHVAVSKRTEWTVGFLVALFIYGTALTIFGLMFILAWLGLNIFGFPPFDFNIKIIGLVSMALGLSTASPFMAAVIYMLTSDKNRLSIRERFMRISALAWSRITKDRLMPKWGFGLNSQYIESSTV